MSSNKKKRKESRTKPAFPNEDKRSIAVTVAWMLTAMATLGAEIVGLIVVLGFRLAPEGTEIPMPLRSFPLLMLFTALVTGAVSVLLIPMVYKFRPAPPPRLITAATVTIAVVPLAALVLISLQ